MYTISRYSSSPFQHSHSTNTDTMLSITLMVIPLFYNNIISSTHATYMKCSAVSLLTTTFIGQSAEPKCFSLCLDHKEKGRQAYEIKLLQLRQKKRWEGAITYQTGCNCWLKEMIKNSVVVTTPQPDSAFDIKQT